MKAMLLTRLGEVGEHTPPLQPAELPIPDLAPGEVRLRVLACGVCHTELDEIEGRTPPPPGSRRVPAAGRDPPAPDGGVLSPGAGQPGVDRPQARAGAGRQGPAHRLRGD